MEVALRVARQSDKELFKNLLNLYHNELGLYCGEFQDVDENGYFDNRAVEAYFSGDKSILPFIVTFDDRVVGFAVVTVPPYSYGENDFCLQEFFIVGYYRGKGISDVAANRIISLFPGKFCAATLKNNEYAVGFLRRVFSSFNGTEKEFDKDFILFEGISAGEIPEQL